MLNCCFVWIVFAPFLLLLLLIFSIFILLLLLLIHYTSLFFLSRCHRWCSKRCLLLLPLQQSIVPIEMHWRWIATNMNEVKQNRIKWKKHVECIGGDKHCNKYWIHSYRAIVSQTWTVAGNKIAIEIELLYWMQLHHHTSVRTKIVCRFKRQMDLLFAHCHRINPFCYTFGTFFFRMRTAPKEYRRTISNEKKCSLVETDRFSSFHFVVILWALWGKQALNHGLFVNFKEKKSRHTDFNHISHWTRYISIHPFICSSAISNENTSESIFTISIYWANRSCSKQRGRETSKVATPWLDPFPRTHSTLFSNVLVLSLCVCRFIAGINL